jgi:hypothetical protein
MDAAAPGVGDGVGTGDGVGDGVGAGVGVGVGAGVGEGVDGEYDDPHPSESANNIVAIVIRRAAMFPPCAFFGASRQSCCLARSSIHGAFAWKTKRVKTDWITSGFDRFRMA